MKKQSKRRPAPRRKPLRQPKQQAHYTFRDSNGKEMGPGEVADMITALRRAKAALINPENVEEFRRLDGIENPSPDEEALLDLLEAKAPEPSKEQVRAALAEIHAEREQKSRGSLVADMKAAADFVNTLIRKELNPKELAEFDAIVETINSQKTDEESLQSKSYRKLIKSYMARVGEAELNGGLHLEGLSIEQILRVHFESVDQRASLRSRMTLEAA